MARTFNAIVDAIASGTNTTVAPREDKDQVKVASGKTHLSKLDREAADQAFCGNIAVQVGETFGVYTVLADDLKSTAEKQIEELLAQGKQRGLTAKMMGLRSECGSLFREALNTTRVQNGLEVYADGTLYNYINRIKQFLDDNNWKKVKGELIAKEQLDLYGYRKQAERQKSGKVVHRSARQVSKLGESVGKSLDAAKQGQTEKAEEAAARKEWLGAGALVTALQQWQKANGGNAALEQLIKMAHDLEAHASMLIGGKKK